MRFSPTSDRCCPHPGSGGLTGRLFQLENITDDEAPIAKLEKQILERLGYQVTVRMSSVDALDAFKADPHRFDLVITDMAMPTLSGEGLAKALIAVRGGTFRLCTESEGGSRTKKFRGKGRRRI